MLNLRENRKSYERRGNLSATIILKLRVKYFGGKKNIQRIDLVDDFEDTSLLSIRFKTQETPAYSSIRDQNIDEQRTSTKSEAWALFSLRSA